MGVDQLGQAREYEYDPRGCLVYEYPDASTEVAYRGPDELRLSLAVVDVGFFGEVVGLRRSQKELSQLTREEREENGAWVEVLNRKFDLLIMEYEEELIPAALAAAVASVIDDLAMSRKFSAHLRQDLQQFSAFVRVGGQNGLATWVVL